MKKFIFPVVAVLFLTLSSFNFLMAKFSANKIDFVLDQVEALANNEEGGESGCSDGGPGAIQCSHSWEVNFYDENGNIIRTDSDSCDVICGQGYYACCRRGGCICVKDNV